MDFYAQNPADLYKMLHIISGAAVFLKLSTDLSLRSPILQDILFFKFCHSIFLSHTTLLSSYTVLWFSLCSSFFWFLLILFLQLSDRSSSLSPYPSSPLKVLPLYKSTIQIPFFSFFSVKLLQSECIFSLELCTPIIALNLFGPVLQLLKGSVSPSSLFLNRL